MTISEHPYRSPAPASGPSGLSDYAVSPLGMPMALLRDEVRVAVLCRTSTEDQQDPRQSIMRQVGNSKHALPEAWVVVANFYDVESGRLELNQRGRKTGYEKFDIPIPRDGGIADLLAEAKRPDRRFDVVICESVSRVARRAFEGLSIERELENADVPLFASNEPITLSGSRAQRVLQRRINQSIAEYEVLNTLEQSWGGLCTHVRDGWNIGKPPHGYRAHTVPHPNPAKAEKGKVKTRLVTDGIRGETVTQIAHWRHYEGLGYRTIADRLNADLDRFPPPEATSKARTRGKWSASSVREILLNPKYTGYQVFNRRHHAKGGKPGRVNQPYLWVWSPQPIHEPLIPKWMYDEINATRQESSRGSRNGSSLNSHPATRRGYLFRGKVIHGCGRKMTGDRKRGLTYYLCWTGKNNRGNNKIHAGGPAAVRVREVDLLEAVCQFYGDRVFGPERRSILEADLGGLDDRESRERAAKRTRLERTIADLSRRQKALRRQAQSGDPDDPFARDLRQDYNDLEAEKNTVQDAIAQLDELEQSEPHKPGAEDIKCLDALPYLALNLAEAPQELLRSLFEATQLQVRLHPGEDEATITIGLPIDQLPQVTQATERVIDTMTTKTNQPATSEGDGLGWMLNVPPMGFEPTLPA